MAQKLCEYLEMLIGGERNQRCWQKVPAVKVNGVTLFIHVSSRACLFNFFAAVSQISCGLKDKRNVYMRCVYNIAYLVSLEMRCVRAIRINIPGRKTNESANLNLKSTLTQLTKTRIS